MPARGSRKRTVRAPRAVKPARPVPADLSLLAEVVGDQVYAVWLEMLRALVPRGRTHRLSVVVAGMLQHAVAIADGKGRRDARWRAVARELLRLSDALYPGAEASEMHTLVGRLFRDAGVSPDRMNARGQAYSILDAAIVESVSWENMPWE